MNEVKLGILACQKFVTFYCLDQVVINLDWYKFVLTQNPIFPVMVEPPTFSLRNSLFPILCGLAKTVNQGIPPPSSNWSRLWGECESWVIQGWKTAVADSFCIYSVLWTHFETIYFEIIIDLQKIYKNRIKILKYLSPRFPKWKHYTTFLLISVSLSLSVSLYLLINYLCIYLYLSSSLHLHLSI